MIGFYTDNEISKHVMRHVHKVCGDTRHIKKYLYQYDHSFLGRDMVFYGLLRGCGTAMRMEDAMSGNYWYIDNGYFDAKYIDRSGLKDLNGTYRIVRNDIIEKFDGIANGGGEVHGGDTFLVLPPSPYTANHFDTTPEDFNIEVIGLLNQLGYNNRIRHKMSHLTLDDDLAVPGTCGVISFNSMAAMRAIQLGYPAYDMHGLLRNYSELMSPSFKPRVAVTFNDMRDFYIPKNFTLDDIAKGRSCLS